MNRLTSKRVNGIKTGYWSPSKKEELVQRLAVYEDTGLEPEEIDKACQKQRPMKPARAGSDGFRYADMYKCPSCSGIFTGTGIADYCYHCGQKLDWGDQDD